MALATGSLWLISGAPGSGKTSVADALAHTSALSIDETVDRILRGYERVAL